MTLASIIGTEREVGDVIVSPIVRLAVNEGRGKNPAVWPTIKCSKAVPRNRFAQAKKLFSANAFERPEGEDWLQGIGLGGTGSNYSVQVNIARMTPEIRGKIPSQVLDVDVVISEVGGILPHDAARQK